MLILLLAACGSNAPIADQPLQGLINGEPWTFADGETDAFLSEGEDSFFTQLYGEAYEPCGFSAPEGPMILLSVPREPAEYQLSFGQSLTFVPAPGENLITTDGEMVVEEVTDTSVTVLLFASYDGDNEVEGRFTATVCASTR